MEAHVKKQDFVDVMRQTHAPLEKMLEMVPDTKLSWAPAAGFMTFGQLIKHVSENWCMVEMMVKNQFPPMSMEQMVEAMKVENIPSGSKHEAIEAAKKDLARAVEYLEREVTEEDFFGKVVNAPWGFSGEIWRALLMAQEHFLNHKMQLHLYLKLCGAAVNTGTLYGG